MALPANNRRVGIAGLALSAAAFVGLIAHEGYTDKAVIPVKGDVPTVGFGSTIKEDGNRVTMADTTTPQKAIARALWHIQKSESGIKRCITAPLTQGEYDILVQFSYQYGESRTCKSGMVKNVNAGNYAAACEVYREYVFVAGRDCRIRANKCYGVITRNEERYAACIAEQS